MNWDKEAIERKMVRTLPPDAKNHNVAFDGESPLPFAHTLKLAVLLDEDDNNRLLLIALREKWPMAVETQLPEARKAVDAERRRMVSTRPLERTA